MVNIGCDDKNVFQNGHKTKVTLQFKEKVVPFVIRVHYFAQKINLVIITLFDVLIVHWLELLLQGLYSTFVHSPKTFVEFQKLVDLLQTKSKKTP